MKVNESVESLRHLQTWEDLKDWVKGNRGILTQISKYPGIEPDEKRGAYGKIWKISGQNLIFKVTTDQEEMEVSTKLSGKNTKGFAKIFFSGTITEKYHRGDKIPPVMYKIVELCYDDPELQQKWVDVLLSDIFYGRFDIYLEKRPLALEIYKLIEDIEDDIKSVGIIAEVDNLDIHKGNIMRDKQGNLKVVDF